MISQPWTSVDLLKNIVGSIPEDPMPLSLYPFHDLVSPDDDGFYPLLSNDHEEDVGFPKSSLLSRRLSSKAPVKDPATYSSSIFAKLFTPDVSAGVHPVAQLPTDGLSYSRREREAFIDNDLDEHVRAQLNQPFGKDNLRQCFKAEACFRHVLLPLMRTGFLDTTDLDGLFRASPYAAALAELVDEYRDVDFAPLRGYPPASALDATEIDEHRMRMTTAALLYFDGDAAKVIRWMGGPHVNANRNTPEVLRFLRGKIDDDVLGHVQRIFEDGSPAACNASATEENFQAFFRYGNHKSCDLRPDVNMNTLLKDSRRGFVALFDERLVPFILNGHLTPQGLVDIDKTYKSPRSIFDSTFRVYLWCLAINDMASKQTEPPLTFQDADMRFMVWLWNMRITYPSLEIYLGDDDISGAFRWIKYHPNLVALHMSRQCGYGVLNTGGTFGDNTTPSNFDPIARAREQLAQWLWSHVTDIEEFAKQYLPSFSFAPTPSNDDVVEFAQADADDLNSGVCDAAGNRLPPAFSHWVDDDAYADILQFMFRTVACSLLALYIILGFPTGGSPDPFSYEKFCSAYNHRREWIGRLWDSRRLTVGPTPRKLAELIAQLQLWVYDRRAFTIRDVASLIGLIDDHLKYCRWGRAWVFVLKNVLREVIRVRYHQVKRQFEREGRLAALQAALPENVASRLASVAAQEHAALMWNSKALITMTVEFRQCLDRLLRYAQSDEHPFEEHIGFIVPRQPHARSVGDASGFGCGAYSPQLEFWFEVRWSRRIIDGLRASPKTPDYLTINALEFVVWILELCAMITWFKAVSLDDQRRFFPRGLPSYPVFQADSDNKATLGFVARKSSPSLAAQSLIQVYTEILRQHHVGTVPGTYVATQDNIVPDDITRPSDNFVGPFVVRSAQLFQKHPFLKSWSFFQPSPGLVQLLSSRVFSKPTVEPPRIPTELGHFVRDVATISCSAEI